VQSPHPRIGRLLAPALALEAIYAIMLATLDLKAHCERFIPLALGAGILYLISVWLVCASPRSKAQGPRSGEAEQSAPQAGPSRLLWFILGAGLLFRATLFPLYPSLSDDLFRYRWDGRMQAAGYNPYSLTPADPALKHLRDETYPGVNGKGYVAAYGPLTESLFRWWYPVTMLPGSIKASVFLMKVPMLAFDLGAALLLIRLLGVLGLPAVRVLIYWWSPVTVIEFAASGHNDSVAVFFLVLTLIGLAVPECGMRNAECGMNSPPDSALRTPHSALEDSALRTPHSTLQPPWWTLPALSLSMLSKLFAAFLWPVVLPRWLERGRWRQLAWPLVCAAVVYWPFRSGLFNVVPGVAVYAGSWRNNDSLFGLFFAFTGSQLGASAAYGAVVAGVAGFLAGRGFPALRSAFLILGTLLCCAPNVFPWYLSWILPLLAVFPNAAWLLFSVLVFLSYNVLIGYGTLGVWRDDTTFLLLEYVPFYLLLIGGWIAGQQRVQGPRSKVQGQPLNEAAAQHL